MVKNMSPLPKKSICSFNELQPQRIYSDRKWAIYRFNKAIIWGHLQIYLFIALAVEQDCQKVTCPLSIADEIPSAANLPYLVKCDIVTTLKKDYAYYAQIEGQLALSKRKYCDFFVFTQVGYFMQRIYFNNSY